MNNYFIPFDITKKIDYEFLLNCYDSAEYNTEEKCFNLIHYSSLSELAGKLLVSYKKLYRAFFCGDLYTNFLKLDTENKALKVLNDFSKESENKKPFVILTQKEVKTLKPYKDNLLFRYFIYAKYYCGYSKSKEQDFTAKQFLSACGYSTKSNSYLSKISEYNKILSQNGLLKITKHTDEKGHCRNSYSLP